MTARALLAAVSFCTLGVIPATAQQGSPSAHCYDGTYYYGTSRREACAHHHGVSEWLGTMSRSQLRTSAHRPAPHRRAARAAPTRDGRHRAGGTKKAGVSRTAPFGATARCHDGSWSTDRRRATACAHHGGIARWLRRH